MTDRPTLTVVPGAASGPNPGGLLLPAPTVQAWLRTHMQAHFTVHEDDDEVEIPAQWTSLGDLMRDDGAGLEEIRQRMLDEGTPPQVAAKYLAGWIAGSVGDAVGHLFALTGAGALLEPDRIPVRQRDEGYIDRVDLSQCTFVVAEGHPWAGSDGVQVVADEPAVCRATLDSFLAVATPMIDMVRRGVKMAPPALWSEVSDGLGMSLGYQPHLPVDELAVDRTMMLLEADGVPWRKHPQVRIGETALGPSYLVLRGGCCFAYKIRPAVEDEDEEELDEEHRAYRERFGIDPPDKRYCGSCSLRPPEDVLERQLFWFERRAATA